MKIQKRAGPKAAEKIMPTAPAARLAWEPYSECIQKLESSIVRHFYEFFSPWTAWLKGKGPT